MDARLRQLHDEAYARQVNQVRRLPGARKLLSYLSSIDVHWAIATSGRLGTDELERAGAYRVYEDRRLAATPG